jgi:hypothetical protein
MVGCKGNGCAKEPFMWNPGSARGGERFVPQCQRQPMGLEKKLAEPTLPVQIFARRTEEPDDNEESAP